jgi:hypothetical protein
MAAPLGSMIMIRCYCLQVRDRHIYLRRKLCTSLLEKNSSYNYKSLLNSRQIVWSICIITTWVHTILLESVSFITANFQTVVCRNMAQCTSSYVSQVQTQWYCVAKHVVLLSSGLPNWVRGFERSQCRVWSKNSRVIRKKNISLQLCVRQFSTFILTAICLFTHILQTIKPKIS